MTIGHQCSGNGDTQKLRQFKRHLRLRYHFDLRGSTHPQGGPYRSPIFRHYQKDYHWPLFRKPTNLNYPDRLKTPLYTATTKGKLSLSTTEYNGKGGGRGGGGVGGLTASLKFNLSEKGEEAKGKFFPQISENSKKFEFCM